MRRLLLLTLLFGFASLHSKVLADKTSSQTSEGIELFEKEIRPLLVEKCLSCHDDTKAQGGLRLTTRSHILKGGSRGASLVLGKPEQSLLVKAIEYRGEVKMPPTGRLSDTDIAKVKRWIALGAPWTETKAIPSPVPNGKFQITDVQRRWWAFQPLRVVAPPTHTPTGQMLSPIDYFIQKERVKRHIPSAAPADRRTLIRRITFDLTGLPPTPAQVDAFLSDHSPSAFTKVVDRLLASKAYAERMTRHWLDVVRYADYHDGDPKTRSASCEPLEAWRYRDWVVSAFNRDLPFDQFILHQIAGDLLPSPDHQEFYADGLVATTFLTNGSWDRGDADKEKMVSDMVDDQIDTIGKAFLGLTLGCARCHNHKFDPISQADYYGLAGIFYSTHILKDIGAKGGEYTLNRIPMAPKAYIERREVQLKQIQEVEKKLANLDKKVPKPSAEDAERKQLVSQRDSLQKELLLAPPMAEAAQEGGTAGGLFPKIQDVPLHIRGSYTRLGAVVPRHLPTFLAGEKQPPLSTGSGRLELARWIASKENLMTARVIVNRLWQWHFGTGLVGTPNNFGMLSEPPSHPALLDWLATQFIADGWSLKKLHRRIVLSATYQQSSSAPRTQMEQDPENRWLGRYSAHRLEAEAIRDAMLSVTGTLEADGGGPATADRFKTCRSLYVQTARWDRGSFALLFDAANPDASVEKRHTSTVAPQALYLLNDEFVLTQAVKLAERLVKEIPTEENARIQRAYQLLFSRPARSEELDLAKQFLVRVGKTKAGTPWRDLAHVLLCSNEFVYLD